MERSAGQETRPCAVSAVHIAPAELAASTALRVTDEWDALRCVDTFPLRLWIGACDGYHRGHGRDCGTAPGFRVHACSCGAVRFREVGGGLPGCRRARVAAAWVAFGILDPALMIEAAL